MEGKERESLCFEQKHTVGGGRCGGEISLDECVEVLGYFLWTQIQVGDGGGHHASP